MVLATGGIGTGGSLTPGKIRDNSSQAWERHRCLREEGGMRTGEFRSCQGAAVGCARPLTSLQTRLKANTRAEFGDLAPVKRCPLELAAACCSWGAQQRSAHAVPGKSPVCDAPRWHLPPSERDPQPCARCSVAPPRIRPLAARKLEGLWRTTGVRSRAGGVTKLHRTDGHHPQGPHPGSVWISHPRKYLSGCLA